MKNYYLAVYLHIEPPGYPGTLLHNATLLFLCTSVLGTFKLSLEFKLFVVIVSFFFKNKWGDRVKTYYFAVYLHIEPPWVPQTHLLRNATLLIRCTTLLETLKLSLEFKLFVVTDSFFQIYEDR